MKDLHNNIKASRALSPTAVSDNTVQTSQTIDMQGYKALEFIIATGTLSDADATFAVTMEEGNQSNMSDAASVPSGSLLGALASASFTFSDDDKVKKIGYTGDKRYVRLKITPSNNASAANLCVIALQGYASDNPVS